MPARKMRVELFDGDGNRYTIAFEGLVTRDKAVKLLDLVELLGGTPNAGVNEAGTNARAGENEPSKYDRLWQAVQTNFPLVWFSSREVQHAYEQVFKEPLNLSTAATYLSRLAAKGMLLKAGCSNRLRYKMASNLTPATLKQSIKW